MPWREIRLAAANPTVSSGRPRREPFSERSPEIDWLMSVKSTSSTVPCDMLARAKTPKSSAICCTGSLAERDRVEIASEIAAGEPMEEWARRIVVEQKAWMDDREFADTLTLCQFMPEPNIVGITV